MQAYSFEPLNSRLLQSLKQGQTLVVDAAAGTLRGVTWGERVIRWLKWRKASRQDQEVAEWLILHLNRAQDSETYPKTLEALAKYAKTCHRTDAVFKRLDNAIFAHKCCFQIPSLQVHELIREDGTATNKLLSFLKQNSLHYVISKANFAHKETSFLLDGEEIYIRAKEGMCFLDTTSQIDLILARIPPEHADIVLLKELRDLLEKEEDNPDKKEVGRIEEIQDQLELSHYYYHALKDIRTNDKGLLLSQAYLADGIEDFEHSKWNELKPNFREKNEKPTYKMRVITRLPAYGLEKTWFATIKTLLLHLFDFRAHGHSWVELAAPIHDKQGNFTQNQNICNVGYYFHPLDRYKRFESADPMAYMPIPAEQIIVNEIEINQEEYEKAKLYINEVQVLLSNPNRDLNDRPANEILSKEEIEDIRYLYKSVVKSTCLSFANTLKEIVTGIETDYRGAARRWLFPKKGFKKWDRLDGFIERTLVLRWLVRLPRFLGRMELPVWVKRPAQQPSVPTQPDQQNSS